MLARHLVLDDEAEESLSELKCLAVGILVVEGIVDGAGCEVAHFDLERISSIIQRLEYNFIDQLLSLFFVSLLQEAESFHEDFTGVISESDDTDSALDHFQLFNFFPG